MKKQVKELVEKFIIQVGSTTFLGEHGAVHTPTLEALTDEFLEVSKAVNQLKEKVWELYSHYL